LAANVARWFFLQPTIVEINLFCLWPTKTLPFSWSNDGYPDDIHV
jgi:hypothetical protein